MSDFGVIEDRIASRERELALKFELTSRGRIEENKPTMKEGSSVPDWQLVESVVEINGSRELTPCRAIEQGGSEEATTASEGESIVNYEIRLPWNQRVEATMRIKIEGKYYYFKTTPATPRAAYKACSAVMRGNGDK